VTAAPGPALLVVDTDVLIDYLRDQAQAVAFLEASDQPLAASVAGLWRRQYGRSHGTGLADALIAASVHAAGASLATLNRRHFPMLANALAPYTKET